MNPKVILLISVLIIHLSVKGVAIQTDLSQVSSDRNDWIYNNIAGNDKLDASDLLSESVYLEVFSGMPEPGNGSFILNEDNKVTIIEKYANEIEDYSILKGMSPILEPYTERISQFRKFNNSFIEIVEMSKEISILKESDPQLYKELRQVINETRAIMIHSEPLMNGDLIIVGRFILDSIYYKFFKSDREKKGKLELITNQY